MAFYSAIVSGIAVLAAQDVFEIVAGPATRVRLREIRLGQISDFGDAAAEGLAVELIRGFTTAGAGGASVTPVNLSGHAGAPAAITVATNMAGRGTDIRLGKGVADLGGLHVISSEWHEAGRIDRQLFGRCGRQGDPGSYQSISSLEDELYRRYCPPVFARLAGGRRQAAAALTPVWLWRAVSRWSQRIAEREDARVRRELMKLDENLGNILAFSGRPE